MIWHFPRVTLVWLFSTMCFQMSPQITCLRRSIVTLPYSRENSINFLNITIFPFGNFPGDPEMQALSFYLYQCNFKISAFLHSSNEPFLFDRSNIVKVSDSDHHQTHSAFWNGYSPYPAQVFPGSLRTKSWQNWTTINFLSQPVPSGDAPHRQAWLRWCAESGPEPGSEFPPPSFNIIIFSDIGSSLQYPSAERTFFNQL